MIQFDETFYKTFNETFWWDIWIHNLDETFELDILMRHFDETFWWEILRRYFDDTFLWDPLIRYVDEIFGWDNFMKNFCETFQKNFTSHFPFQPISEASPWRVSYQRAYTLQLYTEGIFYLYFTLETINVYNGPHFLEYLN